MMRPRPSFPWTPQHLELVRIMAADGATARAIAEALSREANIPVTRNAVIGMARRRAIALLVPPHFARTPRQVTQALALRAWRRKVRSRKEPMLKPIKPVAVPPAGPVTIVGLMDYHCRYPLWGDSRDEPKLYCGEPAWRGSYCQHHRGVAWHTPGRSTAPRP
jgi:hypothetical protein